MGKIDGIQCSIVFYDEDSPQPVYIGFLNDEFPIINNDGDVIYSFDNDIFYYLDEDEVKSLRSYISNGNDKWSCNDEWFIDLSEGIEKTTWHFDEEN